MLPPPAKSRFVSAAQGQSTDLTDLTLLFAFFGDWAVGLHLGWGPNWSPWAQPPPSGGSAPSSLQCPDGR